MDNKRIYEEIVKIREDVSEIKFDIVEIKADVNYHIKRTNLLEETVELLRKQFDPVKHHVIMVNTAVKVLIAAVTILGVVAGIFKSLGI